MTISNHDMSVLDTSTKKVLTDLFAKPNFLEQVPGTFGPGAVGTYMEPRTYRGELNGHIINEIHVDLTGLANAGTDTYAIGLLAGGYCYIGRHTLATHGIVYRIEMIWVETPTQATATYTLDIDLRAEDGADISYGEVADDSVLAAGGSVGIGKTYIDNVPALTTNDYFYLAEGDSAGTTGKYGGGQVIIRMFGHQALTA